ncbi:MAG: hypothetical protein AB1689_21625 [Thermodesulfobacteriota bacterium]
MGRRAARLRAGLAALPVAIASAACDTRAVPVPSYPGGARPSTILTLAGRGARGRGEHVGWTDEEHEAFARRIAALELARCATIDDVSRLAADALEPYDRAALEAAAIDLALRQAGAALADVAGAAPRALRYVVSFERCDDPVARAQRELATRAELGLKVDVDPAWSDATFASLARLGRVAVLDFKLSGAVGDHERAHRLLPGALLEDPLPGEPRWSPGVRDRLSLDAAVTSAAALATLPERPAAVNVKPARMGGVLEALDAVAWCAARDVGVYFGGMFEIGPGRAQLQALAALLCPEAPNDVAPIGVGDVAAPRPPRLAPRRDAGFGGE